MVAYLLGGSLGDLGFLEGFLKGLLKGIYKGSIMEAWE